MGRISSMVAKTKGLFGREMDAYKKETGFIFELKKEFTILLKDPKACVKELKSIKYKTGSLFLKECFEYLVSSPNEVMHLVSGTELGSETYSLDRMLKIEFQASIAGATADMRGLLQKLVEIDESYGHMLLGVFHSHPSKGIGEPVLQASTGTSRTIWKNPITVPSRRFSAGMGSSDSSATTCRSK